MLYDELEGLAQALFEEAGDALFLLNPETEQLRDANGKAQRLTGFSLRDLLRMSLPQLFRFGGSGKMERLRQATSKSGTFHSQEGYFLATVQPDVWIPINLTVSRLHVKPQTLALLTARDLREQRQTHRQFKQLEEELRRILTALPDCLWSGRLDPLNNIVYSYVSPAVADITGQPPSFFVQGANRWVSLVHNQDQARWLGALPRLRSTAATEEKYRIVRPDGTIRWVWERILASPAEDQRLLRLDGMVRDITDYQKTEEKLLQTEHRFRAFVENSPIVAFMKDQKGGLVYYNQSFARIFQTTPASLLGKTAFDMFPADLARQLHRNDAAALAEGRPLELIERVPNPADGGACSWLVFKFPVEGATGGRLLGGLGLELTGRKHLLELGQQQPN